MTALDVVGFWCWTSYGIVASCVLVDWLEAQRQKRLSRFAQRLASARVVRALRK